MGSNRLFERILLPIASESDAEITCAAVIEYLGASVEEVIAAHVIEKGEGTVDKAPLERRQADADAVFAIVHDRLGSVDVPVDTRILYGRSIADTIFEAAEEEDVTVIVFVPRAASRWMDLLTGDVAYTIVTESDRPVVVLPSE